MSRNFTNHSDTELFSMLAEKKKISEAAFAELYARHSQRIYAYCLRVSGNNEDAGDLFQEAFTKFFNSAKENSREISNVPGFLMTITRNLCLNYQRDKKVYMNIDDYSFFTKDKGYEQKELLDLIATALETLDFTHREAFVLRMYHGITYQEIADITNEPLSTIKNRVWRAKEKVKDVLAPYLSDIENDN